jgi:hypothetical protein
MAGAVVLSPKNPMRALFFGKKIEKPEAHLPAEPFRGAGVYCIQHVSQCGSPLFKQCTAPGGQRISHCRSEERQSIGPGNDWRHRPFRRVHPISIIDRFKLRQRDVLEESFWFGQLAKDIQGGIQQSFDSLRNIGTSRHALI